MPVRILQDDPSGQRCLSVAVCVIGAGIAGLIAATRIARQTGRRVLVLESGLRRESSVHASLNILENPAGNYDGLGRARIYGGSSSVWAGKLLPLSPSDTAARPYLDLQAWPIDARVLASYRHAIECLMGVDASSYEAGSGALDPKNLLPLSDPDFACRWAKRPTTRNHRIEHVLRREIKQLDNLDIWLGATATRLEVDTVAGRLKQVHASNGSGQTMTVRADEFLIAAGTLESTRLLLLADRDANYCISNGCRALGHYFNDHMGLDIAILRPFDHARISTALSDRTPLNGARHLHFEVRPEVQQKLGIASAYFDIAATLAEDSALTKTKELAKALRAGGAGFGVKDAAALFKDSPSLARTLFWQVARRQKYWPKKSELRIRIWAEQLPEHRNRLTLSDQRDPLQIPLIRLHWSPGEAEARLFRSTMQLVRSFWERSFAELCPLEWLAQPDDASSELIGRASDLAHPAGSTRMGTQTADSVVDTQLRVHRLPNVSVASASVFPSSGSANPTLTIMALAMHASSHIARRIR